jgi:hypothetical protein
MVSENGMYRLLMVMNNSHSFSVISWSFLGHFLVIFWSFLGHFLDISWSFLGHFLVISWLFLGHLSFNLENIHIEVSGSVNNAAFHQIL